MGIETIATPVERIILHNLEVLNDLVDHHIKVYETILKNQGDSLFPTKVSKTENHPDGLAREEMHMERNIHTGAADFGIKYSSQKSLAAAIPHPEIPGIIMGVHLLP